jgi:hypothetical protein
MNNSRSLPYLVLAALGLCLTTSQPAMAAYKCQGSDGKIEYSDRPCETNKNTVDRPNANRGIQSKPIAVPMETLQKLFVDFEPRLCEREALSVELDIAGRKGDISKQPAEWRPKQDKLIELNDVMVDFQLRAGKITKPAGNDSPEMAALRKFQASLKGCAAKVEAAAKAADAAAKAAAPAKGAPAAPVKK